MFPCRYACAVYRKWKEVDFNYVLTNLVDKNYTFANVKSTFKRNVFPVTLDGIKYDGVTKPPLVVARPSSRPRTRRIRRRSKFLAAEDSPVVCSNCGIRGHNRRTCTNPARERTNLITNSEFVEATYYLLSFQTKYALLWSYSLSSYDHCCSKSERCIQ